MRFGFFALALTAAIGLVPDRQASAQVVLWTSPSVLAPGVSLQPPLPTYIPSYGVPRVVNGGYYLPTYDYYGNPYPLPPRIYAPYGANDGFPFYGRAYGHAYEPWTWEGMSRWPAYPPVRVVGAYPGW